MQKRLLRWLLKPKKQIPQYKTHLVSNPQVKYTESMSIPPIHPTLLTFISGTLVGGNYDDIIDQEEVSSNQGGDLFEGMNVI